MALPTGGDFLWDGPLNEFITQLDTKANTVTTNFNVHVTAFDPHSVLPSAASAADAKISAHAQAADPHGDRAWALTKFLQLSAPNVVYMGNGDVTRKPLELRIPAGSRAGAPNTFEVSRNTGTDAVPVWTSHVFVDQFGQFTIWNSNLAQVPFTLKALGTPTANQMEVLDSGSVARVWIDSVFRLRSSNNGKTFTLNSVGNNVVGVLPVRIYNDTLVQLAIRSVRISCAVAPTGTTVIVDIFKNGTTIFTDQTKRPVIAVGALTSGRIAFPITNVIQTVESGDVLTASITQIGSTLPGTNMVVQIEAY